jgi:tetratricopeptide (TPR) repeat protein
VVRRLHEVAMDPEECAPYLLKLLGVKEGTERLAGLRPEAVKAKTFATLRQICLTMSRHQPLLVAVEDLHWLDQTSEDYLASLVESLAGSAILVLVTHRPGYRPSWLDKSYATQLALHPLPSQDSLRVVHATRGRAPLPEPVAQAIVAKAEGNPFFLEELPRAVLEHGASHPDLPVPDTIQGVLMARLDRLPEAAKRLAQTAAVMGRNFMPRLLAAVWDGTAPLGALLLELKRREFLYERTGGDEPVHVFKHALTQEVAYESLLITRRQALHLAAGQALEALYAERLEEVYDRLAYHYARTDKTNKAVEYLTRLAEKAVQSYAHAEAVAIWHEARAHAERLPATAQDRRMLEMLLRQADSLFYLGRRQEMVDLLLHEQGRLEQLQEPWLAGRSYAALTSAYSFLGQRAQGLASAQLALEAAMQGGDAATMGEAHLRIVNEYMFSGPLEPGIEHGRQAVALLERTEERSTLGGVYYILGLLYALHGDFALALEVASRVATIGQAIGTDACRRTQLLLRVGSLRCEANGRRGSTPFDRPWRSPRTRLKPRSSLAAWAMSISSRAASRRRTSIAPGRCRAGYGLAWAKPISPQASLTRRASWHARGSPLPARFRTGMDSVRPTRRWAALPWPAARLPRQ